MGDELRAQILDELREAKIGAPRMRRAVLIDSGLGISPPPRGRLKKRAGLRTRSSRRRRPTIEPRHVRKTAESVVA